MYSDHCYEGGTTAKDRMRHNVVAVFPTVNAVEIGRIILTFIIK